MTLNYRVLAYMRVRTCAKMNVYACMRACESEFGCAFVYDHFKLSKYWRKCVATKSIICSMFVYHFIHKNSETKWIMFTIFCFYWMFSLSLALQSSNSRAISHANTETYFTYNKSNMKARTYARTHSHSHSHWCHFRCLWQKTTNLFRTKFSFSGQHKICNILVLSERVCPFGTRNVIFYVRLCLCGCPYKMYALPICST